MTLARMRCKVSLIGATAVMPGSSPDATMIQPTARLQAAESAEPKESQRQSRRAPRRPPEPDERREKGEADQAPELAVAPFPPVDHLERVEGHAAG